MSSLIENERSSFSILIQYVLLIAIGIAVLVWLSPFVVIDAGHRGVLTNFGAVQQEVFNEGLHWRVPIMQTVHEINVQIQKAESDADSASKDLQQVHTKIAINFHLDPVRVADTFQAVGNLETVGDRIITPSVQEAVKVVTANYTAEELVSRRAEVREKISSFLHDRLTRHGITIDEFSIVNFAFSRSFNEAIEAKTTAEQLKLKAERDLERIRVEAEQKVASAKAEAEALHLQKQEVTPELLRLREIENQAKAIEKWDGKLPSVTSGAVPLINMNTNPR